MDNLYPLSTRWFRMVTVFLSEASLVELVIRMLSGYWRRIPDSRCRSFRSLAKVSPKMVGEFLNPWGRIL